MWVCLSRYMPHSTPLHGITNTILFSVLYISEWPQICWFGIGYNKSQVSSPWWLQVRHNEKTQTSCILSGSGPILQHALEHPSPHSPSLLITSFNFRTFQGLTSFNLFWVIKSNHWSVLGTRSSSIRMKQASISNILLNCIFGSRLIVVAEKEIVYEKFPIPLINRLEKHKLSTKNMLTLDQLELSEQLHEWAVQFATINDRGVRPIHNQRYKVHCFYYGSYRLIFTW